MYKLEYLPIACQDMIDIARYISQELKNPIAAKRLAAEFIKAEDRIKAFPYSNPVYIPIRPLNYEYRKLAVKNYLMFYWIEEEKKTVTIARIIYAKRDYAKQLGDF